MTIAYAYAPFDISYALRTPYISVLEFQQYPNAIDTANLLPGGPGPSQAVALQEVIAHASSWIDTYCYGAYGTLCSTLQTENCRSWGTYRGTLSIKTRTWPVTEVRSVSFTPIPVGLANGAGAASVIPAGNVTVYPQSFEVKNPNEVTAGFGFLGASGIVRGVEYDVQYAYLSGFPQTTLGASVAAGATSIQPSIVNGIYPGSQLTIYDLPNDEQINVATSYVAGASVVPLVAPLQFAHQTTATVTNLPPVVKQAAVLVTTAFIKIRGSSSLTVADMGMITHQTPGIPQGGGDDLYRAGCLLDVFKQQYVGW